MNNGKKLQSGLEKLLQQRRARARQRLVAVVAKDEVSPKAPFSPTAAITASNKRLARRLYFKKEIENPAQLATSWHGITEIN
jgi:hypothetical protein